MAGKKGVLCIGEILWDALPGGLFLGGAPLNVCYHLNQLGVSAEMAGRVGDDRLGQEALRRIQHTGISPEHIQTDERAETGFVTVEIGENGDPAYDIVKPAAWDFIEAGDALQQAAGESWGLVFGSLAQRHPSSRKAIQTLWESDARKILDINLRPPYIDKRVIRESLEAADIIKMNKDELTQLKKWYSLPDSDRGAVEQLADVFSCSLICVTEASVGAVMFKDGSWYRHCGYRVKAKDSVGAGDAFLAAMIYGLQNQMDAPEILKYANAAGSLVARKSGATPEYDIPHLKAIVKAGEDTAPQ